MLVLPRGFADSGLLMGPIILILSLMFTLACTFKIVECREFFPGAVSQIARHVAGDLGKRITDILAVLSQVHFLHNALECIRCVLFSVYAASLSRFNIDSSSNEPFHPDEYICLLNYS